MTTIECLPAGTILHGYEHTYKITRCLGSGSFGITYLAAVKMEGSLGTIEIHVAVKEFFMADRNGRNGSVVTCSASDGLYEKYKRKFKNEALNLARLAHKNIVKVLELIEANNTVYYVMEYADGGSLDERIRSSASDRLDEATTLRYARQIAVALQYIHSHKMLHLDLKPSNVMLRSDGSAVLIDFGLAKQYDADGVAETSTTVGRGTAGYAPMEQADYHEGKAFAATMDIYAFGATMYKMLTGKTPPGASDIFNNGFPREALSEAVDGGLSRATAVLIERCMSPRKSDRYQNMGEIIALLGVEGVEPVVEDDETAVDFETKEDDETDFQPKKAESTLEKGATIREGATTRKAGIKAEWTYALGHIWKFALSVLCAVVATLFIFLMNEGVINDSFWTPVSVVITALCILFFLRYIYPGIKGTKLGINDLQRAGEDANIFRRRLGKRRTVAAMLIVVILVLQGYYFIELTDGDLGEAFISPFFPHVGLFMLSIVASLAVYFLMTYARFKMALAVVVFIVGTTVGFVSAFAVSVKGYMYHVEEETWSWKSVLMGGHGWGYKYIDNTISVFEMGKSKGYKLVNGITGAWVAGYFDSVDDEGGNPSLFIVRRHSSEGLIDSKGNQVIPMTCKYVKVDWNEGIATATGFDGTEYVIDLNSYVASKSDMEAVAE